MNKKKGARFSIKLRIRLVSTIINVLICAVMGIAVYQYVHTSYIKTAADHTLAIAQISSRELNGNLLGLLETGSDDSYANTVMREDMAAIVNAGTISSIYTAGMRDGQLVYLACPSDAGITIGTPVDGPRANGMENALGSAGYVLGEIEKTSNGTNVISAYAPITNKAGEVVGVLGIDYIVNDIVASLKGIIETTIIIAIILSAVSIFASILLANGIGSGLSKVDKKVRDLVSNDGDLTKHIDVKGNDEVADIAYGINHLLEYIREVVSSIYDSSNKLSGSVETALDTTVKTNDQLDGVSATMEQMSAAMEETSASLQQVQSSTVKIKDDVQEMYSSVKEGTDYASQMAKRAIDMRKHAEEETEAARIAADDMTQSLNDKIEKSKAVEGISGLTQTILDIASQTNLLSLNASIEAARAGEHGRGFAVVAEEISSLATNSAETAKQIQIISDEVIGNVRDLADEATKMIDFVRDKTIGGYQQLMDTGVQYQDDAEKLSDMLKNVDAASQNIENSMNFVSDAMDDVSAAVEESARGVSHVAEAVMEMSDNMKANKTVVNENAQIAQQLDDEVNKFKF